MPVETANEREARILRQFEANTSEHVMEVLRDDGVYRHLRFGKPGTGFYSYSLVTWPGHLCINGDCETFVFRRLHDMAEFFTDNGYGINAHYWGEKLVAPRGRSEVKVFDQDVASDRVREWLADIVEDMEPERAAALTAAVERDLLNDWDSDLTYEDGFLRALRDFEHDGIEIHDPWEWEIRVFDHHFIYACWAIVKGLERYRDALSEDGGNS